MLRRVLKMRIVFFIILIIVLMGVLVRGINLFGFGSSDESSNPSWAYKNKLERKENIDGVNSIVFKLDVGEAILKTTDKDEIAVVERSNKNLKKHKLIIDKTNNELTFREPTNRIAIFNFGTNNKKVVEISLPKKYQDKLYLYSDVGNIKIKSDLNLKELELESDVGKVIVEGNIKADIFKSNSDAGDTKIARLEAKKFDIRSDVGKVIVESALGKGKVESDVGDVIFNFERIEGDSDFRTDVGKVILNINKDETFNLETDCR